MKYLLEDDSRMLDNEIIKAESIEELELKIVQILDDNKERGVFNELCELDLHLYTIIYMDFDVQEHSKFKVNIYSC